MKLLLATITAILAISFLILVWWLAGAMPTAEEQKGIYETTN